MRRENNIKYKVMNYDLIELAKRCSDLAITVRLADLVEANRGLIEETKRELAQSLEASKPETYLTREKVMEMLEVSPTTLWRWEKCGYLIPISIDDLAKEVGVISTRLRKIEERLREPMEIADPILNPVHSREYSRDTCIYGALIKSIEACMVLTEQKKVLNDIVSDVRYVKSALETIKNDHDKQNKASEDMITTIKENAENIESKHKLVFAMFFLIVIVIVALALMLKPSLH